jgi:hypothetical protein
MVSNTKYFTSVLAAAAVGTLAGYLWAQEENTPLGQRIKRTLGNWAGRTLDDLDRRSGEINPDADDWKREAGELRSRAEEAEEEFRERIEFGFSRREL